MIGVIQTGKFTGKRIVLKDKQPTDRMWLVEESRFPNGAAVFHKACLHCEEFIGDTCDTCGGGE